MKSVKRTKRTKATRSKRERYEYWVFMSEMGVYVFISALLYSLYLFYPEVLFPV